jgi:hypothetical protein
MFRQTILTSMLVRQRHLRLGLNANLGLADHAVLSWCRDIDPSRECMVGVTQFAEAISEMPEQHDAATLRLGWRSPLAVSGSTVHLR